jgi:Flp pilus assembly protein TadD
LPAGLTLALILIAAIILHRGVFGLPFFADDYLILEQVRGRSLLAALLAPDAIGNFFRPVGRQLYFWVLAHASGESPRAFHATNLVLFLGVITLLFAVVRRLAGTVAAAVAAAFAALHYAADVPLLWVAGCQDLLAVLGALGAIALYLAGRRAWAALILLVALLSKETVLFTPLIAAAAARRRDERWASAIARAWPLGMAVVVWAVLWLVTAPQRRGLGGSLGFEPTGPIAVIAHLVHVAAGIEWRGAFEAVGRAVPPLLPLLAVLIAVVGARAGTTGPAPAPASDGPRRPAWPPSAIGAAWALAAVVPLFAVAATWSAYYYLFALCGVALVIGSFAARAPRWVAAVVVAVLVAGSASGRNSQEFASGRGAWTFQSRVNRRYVERASDLIARYLDDMKRMLPSAPPHSTMFFANIPGYLAWQAADGPLVRWAYRDTSLRSYYLSDFSLARAKRGPVFFFYARDDSMHQHPTTSRELRGMALNILINERVESARDLLTWLGEREPGARDLHYFRAWVEWSLGDTVAGTAALRQAEIGLDRDGGADVVRAAQLAAVGDSAAAEDVLVRAIERHGLDARLHGMISDLSIQKNPGDAQARVEAWAARALAPQDAMNWLRWGVIQAYDGRHSQAIRTLEHALAMGGIDPARAASVRAVLAELRRMVPGGELAQEALRAEPGRRDAAPEGGRSP